MTDEDIRQQTRVLIRQPGDQLVLEVEGPLGTEEVERIADRATFLFGEEVIVLSAAKLVTLRRNGCVVNGGINA